MTHDELRSLLTAYSLDALVRAEQAEVAQHVAGCPECGAELRAHLQVAHHLALLADPVSPPPELRGRVLAAVLAPQPAAQAAQPAPAPGVVSPTPASPTPARFPPAPRLRRRHGVNRRSYQRFLAVAGARAGLPLEPAQVGSLAAGTLYIDPEGRSAWLLAGNLPQPGRHVYQVWSIVDGVPAPTAAFRPDARGRALVAIPAGPSGMAPGTVAAVTLERRAGHPAPRGTMVMASAALPS